MTGQNDAEPHAVTVGSLSSLMLQVQRVLASLALMPVKGPYSLQNLMNPMRKSSKLALKSFHSCKMAGSGAVLMGCGCCVSSSTGRSMMVALERGREVLVGFPCRKFGGS